MVTTKHDGDYSLTGNRDHGDDKKKKKKHDGDYSLTRNRDRGDDKNMTGIII